MQNQVQNRNREKCRTKNNLSKENRSTLLLKNYVLSPNKGNVTVILDKTKCEVIQEKFKMIQFYTGCRVYT